MVGGRCARSCSQAVGGRCVHSCYRRWGVRVCGQLVVIVGVQVCGRLVVVVYIRVRGLLVVVVGGHVVCCVQRGHGHSLLFMFVGTHQGGDHCGWWLPCIVVVVGSGRGRSLLCASMVVVRRKEAMSHIVTMASQLTFHVRSHVNVSHEDQAWNFTHSHGILADVPRNL